MRKVRDYRSARSVLTLKKDQDQDRSHYGSSLTTAKGDGLTGTATGVSLDAIGMRSFVGEAKWFSAFWNLKFQSNLSAFRMAHDHWPRHAARVKDQGTNRDRQS
jgi:hypothetical protein